MDRVILTMFLYDAFDLRSQSNFILVPNLLIISFLNKCLHILALGIFQMGDSWVTTLFFVVTNFW